MGQTVQLAVPERNAPKRDTFNIRHRKVAQWINALPRANLGETARQIFTTLRETNQYAYPYQDRLRFLEMMREPVQYVTSSMKKHFVGVKLPLPEKNQQIANITREIYCAMAIGYKVALQDELRYTLLFSDKKSLALLTHRAISYTGLAILTCYQTYAPYTPRLWSELHRLYRFAEERKLLKLKVADYQHSHTEKTTVAAEYARILMVALASPYHLRQGEVAKVYENLERWIPPNPLRRLTDLDMQNEGSFVVSLAEDNPPQALSLMNAGQYLDPAEIRIIDNRAISEYLRKELKSSGDFGTSTISSIEMARIDISQDLMRRLQIAWDMVSSRSFARMPKNEEVKVVIGLNAAHKFINQRAQPMDFTQTTRDLYANRAQFEASDIRLPNQREPSEDVWNMIYPANPNAHGLEPLVESELSLLPANSLSLEPKKQPLSLQGDEPEDSMETDNWAIQNESPKGFMLHSSQDCTHKAQVGELISIRRQVNDRSWKWGIGVIRWIKFNQDKSMQMGIEMLNPNAAAIGIRAANQSNQPMHRTLMLPEIKSLKQPATLITGPVPWRVGNKITMHMLGKDITATLTKSLQNTGLFAQFEFVLDSNKPQVQKAPDNNEPDFSSVWSTI